MSRLFYHVMQDNLGNLLFDVTGTFRLAGSGTLATIYGDEALTVILPNPMTNHPSFGSFKAFLGAGDYDFYLSKAGYTFETLTGVQGHGTMAQQDASAVAITGGSAVLSSVGIGAPPTYPLDVTGQVRLSTQVGIGRIPVAGVSLATGEPVLVGNRLGVNATPDTYALAVGGDAFISARAGIGHIPQTGHMLWIDYQKSGVSGVSIMTTDNDTGPFPAIGFYNVARTAVGQIATTATTTSYTTSSDSRLKHAITALTGELALLQALRPVAFRWNADDSPGVGFLAQEVAQHVPGVITGEADAVDEDGNITPQMIDYSKLVPFLVGAVQTLAARLEGMEARLHVLEDALGV